MKLKLYSMMNIQKEEAMFMFGVTLIEESVMIILQDVFLLAGGLRNRSHITQEKILMGLFHLLSLQEMRVLEEQKKDKAIEQTQIEEYLHSTLSLETFYFNNIQQINERDK